jgi:4-hydroxybenzoate polyprenyltransferase
MVRFLQSIVVVLRLIRWYNLVIIVLTQVLLRQFVLIPLLQKANMQPQMSGMLFALLVAATVCIAAGGYAINDYFDRKIDRVNKPDSLIVGKKIYPRRAMAWHLFFTLAGILIGTYVALKIGEVYLSLVFFMTSGLLWFYSTTYKRQLLLGNIIVALFTGGVPFLVLLYELPLLAHNYGAQATPISRYLMIWVLGFSLFAFLLNLIREIVKDTEDFKGDHAFGKRTVPVVWGTGAVRVISLVLISATIALLVFAWYFFVRDNITLVYFLLTLILPLIIAAVLILKGSEQKQWHQISTLLKIIMLAGLVYMAIVKLIIDQFE